MDMSIGNLGTTLRSGRQINDSEDQDQEVKEMSRTCDPLMTRRGLTDGSV